MIEREYRFGFKIVCQPYHFSVPFVPFRVDIWKISYWWRGRRLWQRLRAGKNHETQQSSNVYTANSAAWTGRLTLPYLPKR